MSFLHHDSLPTELWLEIFTHLDGRSYTSSHAPFQPTPGVASEGGVGSAYSAVCAVCRDWRAWAIELMYRNIKISDGVRMNEGLDVPREYGRWVRRAVVPYSTTATETCKPLPSTEVLGLCPNLEVLVRPPHSHTSSRRLRFEFDATCPALVSLKRLEWWNNWEASRTGGINSITAVLLATPNLEYLFIGGVPYSTAPFYGLVPQIHLPSLRTLRLSINNAMLLQHIVHRWALPALNTMVLDSPIVGAMDMIWETLGPQLEFVEFGRHIRFLLDPALTPCLQGCPSLREINYYVFLTAPPELAPGTDYPSVTSIGINMLGNAFLEETRAEWDHLAQHFDALAGSMFPNLRRLRLFAASEWLLADVRFKSMHQRMIDRGCMVEFLDGTPA
ncbi:hypothetical protein DFH09DRAFT_1020616 [Mycena vulgaris]|nr:hypothetical protein DFH09DRAFT_1020616 [Mycena vulgaris]